MSWLSISLSNPFKSQHSDEENLKEEEEEDYDVDVDVDVDDDESSFHGGGVKEDLSELGKTIGRQLWGGVASFLAPPPVTPSATTGDSQSDSSTPKLLGIRNDFAEIGGSFKSGLSLLSTNKAVNEISRLATNLLQFQKDADEDESSFGDTGGGVVRVSEEVLEFAREMSIRPECWIDFPLSLHHEFDISDAQREHASTVERLAPSLEALRVRLCPSHMNEGHFWMIYFILLHPRLNEQDTVLLSTPQIVETRNALLEKIQNRMNTQVQSSNTDDISTMVSSKGYNVQEEKNTAQEKEVLAETVKAASEVDVDEQNIDRWLEEEDVETSTSVDTQKQLGNEEDVSFSDLEDDENDASNRRADSRTVQDAGVSSPNGSNEWIQLSGNSYASQSSRKKAAQPVSREKDSEGEESNDWLTVDASDSECLGTA